MFIDLRDHLQAAYASVKTGTIRTQAEAINKLFGFLDMRKEHQLPPLLCLQALRLLEWYPARILPEQGFEATDVQEIGRDYTTLISQIGQSAALSQNIEQAFYQLIGCVQRQEFSQVQAVIDAQIKILRMSSEMLDTGQIVISPDLQDAFTGLQEQVTNKRVITFFERLLSVLIITSTSYTLRFPLPMYQMRTLFEYLLHTYFESKAILVDTFGEGMLVPLHIVVDRRRTSAQVDFWNQHVDEEMQTSADIARAVARTYLLERFGRKLPDNLAVRCQFDNPAAGYRDTSASLLIGLRIAGSLLGLEHDPVTVVTGALNPLGQVLRVGDIAPKIKTVNQHDEITRLIIPADNLAELQSFAETPSVAIIPVRTFAEALEHYYGQSLVSLKPAEVENEASELILSASSRRELTQLTWQPLREICVDITQLRMTTVQGKYHAQLYLQRAKARQSFEKFLRAPDKKCFILIGKSGVGKSNFLLALREELQQPQYDQIGVLMYDGANLDVEPSLTGCLTQDFTTRLKLPGREIEDIWQEIDRIDGIKDHILVLYIDALNEHPQAKTLLKQVNELVQQPYPWLKIVCSSRPETWHAIKRGVKLAENLYYREEGAETIGVELEPFQYSEQLEPFSRQELPEVYAKYQQAFHVRTDYQALRPDQRELLRDPLSLWLVAQTNKDKAIPETLKATELIEQYVQQLVKQERLNLEDLWLLETQIVSLMVRAGHYSNALTLSEIRIVGEGLYERLYQDQAAREGGYLHRSLRNLIDAEILVRQEEGWEQRIAFKYERFYEYFVGRRIFELSRSYKDLPVFFSDLVNHIVTVPFLWGAVRNALIQETIEYGLTTVLSLCFTDQQRVKEMLVDVLTNWGRDQPAAVSTLLERLLPAKERLSRFQNILQLLGKLNARTDVLTSNARRIAVEVASNLHILPVLQTAAMHADPAIRTAAVRAIYHLWQRDQDTGFKVLESLAERITHHRIPHLGGFETLLGLSFVIFFDHYQKEVVLEKLRGVWRKIIDKVFLIRTTGSQWGNVVRKLLRERLFSIGVSVIFQVLKELKELPVATYLKEFQEIDLSFRSESPEKALYQRLIRYLDTQGDYSKEQMEADFLAVLKVKNILLGLLAFLGLAVHTWQGYDKFLSFLKKFFEETQKFPFLNIYVDYVPELLWEILFQNPMAEEVFTLFLHTWEGDTQYHAKYPHAAFPSPEANFLGPYIFIHYQRNGSIRTQRFEELISNAVACNNLPFFDFFIQSELSLVGIALKQPRIALDALALFFNRRTPEIEQMLRSFLSRMRIYYPDDVDSFLEEQDAPEEFRLQVRKTEPSETIGELMGMKCWHFLRDACVEASSPVFFWVTHMLGQAVECKNMQAWMKYCLGEIVNVIYGEEVLRQGK